MSDGCTELQAARRSAVSPIHDEALISPICCNKCKFVNLRIPTSVLVRNIHIVHITLGETVLQ